MERQAKDLLGNIKDLIELKKLLLEYKMEKPGIADKFKIIYEYLDAEIYRAINDFIHIEDL